SRRRGHRSDDGWGEVTGSGSAGVLRWPSSRLGSRRRRRRRTVRRRVMRLSVRDLSFSYGPRPVIAHLDHAFPIGGITAITGPSGQGKSTLLYLLGLMLTPTSGEVLLDE